MTEIPQIRPRRSFIFTPGLRPDMFSKALDSGADMVCVELEDGIAPKDKAEARCNALALFEQPLAEDSVEKLVRINSIRERFGIEDLDAILKAKTAPPGLMIPKVHFSPHLRFPPRYQPHSLSILLVSILTSVRHQRRHQSCSREIK